MSFGKCESCGNFVSMEEFNASIELRDGDSTQPPLCFACTGHELVLLRGLMEKLPKYEDTGERFVPGQDDCWEFWVTSGGGVQNFISDMPPKDEEGSWRGPFYSTKAAALTAKDKDQ